MHARVFCALASATLLLAGPARAADTDGDEAEKSFVQTLSFNADKGGFLPFSQAARFDGVGIGRILSGYDSSYHSAVLDMSATAHVWGPISIQAGAVLVDDAKMNSQGVLPSAAVRVQALKQEKHGIDAAVIVQYRPEGLTVGGKDFGELETVIAVSRNFGRIGVFGNLVYGQDPDANDRDGEVRVSGLYAFSDRLRAGFDTRARFDLGSNPASLRQNNKATLDVVAGGTASYVLGPVALVAEAGYSGVDFGYAGGGGFRSGLIALGGLGTAF